MKLSNNTEVRMNTHTKECHAEEPLPQCNTAYIEDEVILSWKEAKAAGGDGCKNCYPQDSKVNDGKKEEKTMTLEDALKLGGTGMLQ